MNSDPEMIALFEVLRPQLQARANEMEKARLRTEHAKSFAAFAEHFYPYTSAGVPLEWDIPATAICLHLQAVIEGRIRRLLINVPPGSSKSLFVSVLLPAYLWGPGGKPQKDILAVSNTEDVALRDAGQMRDLITSKAYQELYGDKVQLKSEALASFETTRGGARRSRSIARATGLRGDLIIADDANATGTDSKAERTKASTAWRESLISRGHDPRDVIFIVVQQRTHPDDLSGEILRGDYGFVHLCLPMRFDPERVCETSIGWRDPRTVAGELLSSNRHTEEEVLRFERTAGPFAVAAHYQQNPQPRDGFLFKREWLQEVEHRPLRIVRECRAVLSDQRQLVSARYG